MNCKTFSQFCTTDSRAKNNYESTNQGPATLGMFSLPGVLESLQQAAPPWAVGCPCTHFRQDSKLIGRLPGDHSAIPDSHAVRVVDGVRPVRDGRGVGGGRTLPAERGRMGAG